MEAEPEKGCRGAIVVISASPNVAALAARITTIAPRHHYIGTTLLVGRLGEAVQFAQLGEDFHVRADDDEGGETTEHHGAHGA